METKIRIASEQCLYIEWAVTDGNPIEPHHYAELMVLHRGKRPCGADLIRISDMAMEAFGASELPAKPSGVVVTYKVTHANGFVSLLKNGFVVLHQ